MPVKSVALPFVRIEWQRLFRCFDHYGSEVRDIVFRDSEVIHVEDGAVLSLHNGEFATANQVRFEIPNDSFLHSYETPAHHDHAS